MPHWEARGSLMVRLPFFHMNCLWEMRNFELMDYRSDQLPCVLEKACPEDYQQIWCYNILKEYFEQSYLLYISNCHILNYQHQMRGTIFLNKIVFKIPI